MGYDDGNHIKSSWIKTSSVPDVFDVSGVAPCVLHGDSGIYSGIWSAVTDLLKKTFKLEALQLKGLISGTSGWIRIIFCSKSGPAHLMMGKHFAYQD